VLAGIGLFQGFVIWLMTDVWDERPLELRSAAIGFVVAGGLTAQFTHTGSQRLRQAAVSLGFGAVIGAVSWWVFAQHGEPGFGDGVRAGTWAVAAFAALYVAMPFAEIWQRTGELRFPYPELFKRSWASFFVGLIASLFTSVTALLFVLWGALFSLVEIDFFEEIFESEWFVAIVYAGVFGFGLAVGLEAERITDALRRVLFAICQVLLPVVAFVALLFGLVLPWTGLAPLWDTGHATPVLLGIVALLVLFGNAVYQDGSGAQPYPLRLDLGVRAALAVTPLYVAVAAYSTWLRVGQYGLTPDRVWAFVAVFVCGCYAVSYATAIVLGRSRWIAAIGRINVALAPVMVALALVLHTPLLDPLRRSASQQEGRLVRGDVTAEAFDYGLLRFELGHAGEAALARLERDAGAADAAVVRERIAAVRGAENRWAWRKLGGDLGAEVQFVTLPPFVVPEALRQVYAHDWGIDCTARGGCLAFEAGLSVESLPVVCFAQGTSRVYALRCFVERGDGWALLGDLRTDENPPPTRDALIEQLRARQGKPVEPAYRDFAIGGSVYRFGPR